MSKGIDISRSFYDNHNKTCKYMQISHYLNQHLIIWNGWGGEKWEKKFVDENLVNINSNNAI